jgi:hypothetical protein
MRRQGMAGVAVYPFGLSACPGCGFPEGSLRLCVIAGSDRVVTWIA